MSKKVMKKKVQAKPEISKFAAPVVDSAREIWLAGLGALTVAQTESVRLVEQGNKLFDKLVSEGEKLERKTRKDAETAVDGFVDGVESKVDEFRQQATENWDNLANVFDDRVSGTLDRLGVPTTKDLSKLSGNVQRMSRQAAKNWKELEAAFDQRVSGALDNLHVPGAEDLNKLSDSVQKVSKEAAENLGKLSDNVQKVSMDAADNFGKLTDSLQESSRVSVEKLEKFESMFEARVTEILSGMGIPTTTETDKLAAELKKLSKQMVIMEKRLKAKAATPKAAPKTAVKKAPASKAVPTKVASKKTSAPKKAVTTH